MAFRQFQSPRSVNHYHLEAKKSEHDEFEAEIDALSSHSSDPEAPEIFNPIGKTPEEIAVWCAEYERGNRRMMAERRRAGLECQCIYHATLMYLTCTDVMLAAIRDMAARARASTPQTLARKRSKGYAPRLVATGTYSSDYEDVIIVNETGSHTF